MAKTPSSKTGTKAAPRKSASAAKKPAARKTAAKKPVVDDTAPGEGPVVVSATEARASEPVLTTEEALQKDTPPPASTSASATRKDGELLERDDAPTSGAGDYVGDTHATTGDPGEPEFNAAVHQPSAGEKTVDGVRYADVADPSDPNERLMKREIELGAEMDYAEHRRTYAMFMNATKWGTVIVIALLVAMAVGFFMAGGFLGGIVVFLGAALAGIWFMR